MGSNGKAKKEIYSKEIKDLLKNIDYVKYQKSKMVDYMKKLHLNTSSNN